MNLRKLSHRVVRYAACAEPSSAEVASHNEVENIAAPAPARRQMRVTFGL
jgi:hypothetical protein